MVDMQHMVRSSQIYWKQLAMTCIANIMSMMQVGRWISSQSALGCVILNCVAKQLSSQPMPTKAAMSLILPVPYLIPITNNSVYQHKQCLKTYHWTSRPVVTKKSISMQSSFAQKNCLARVNIVQYSIWYYPPFKPI